MALNWKWDEKCGEAIMKYDLNGEEKEYVLDLYQGNAYMIFIANYEENGKQMYNVWGFWVDKDHAKNCLGIGKSKDCYNIYAEEWRKIVGFRLNKSKTKYLTDIVSMIAKAFDDITIEVYSEKGE